MLVSRELRQLKSLADARRILWDSLSERVRARQFRGRAVEISKAVGHVLSEDVICPADLPPFDRSTMDGFAVRAEDTFGASEGLPAYLKLVGQIVMGEQPDLSLSAQQAAAIPTGGMLPEGADAVVMVEHTQAWTADTVEVLRPVAPGENIVRGGDDVKKGDVIISAGQTLRPQDVSALAGLGIAEVMVGRAVVGVLSTGSELVLHTAEPEVGQIRDMNGPALQAAVLSHGGEPLDLGIVPDDQKAIRSALKRGLAEADLLLVSGGTSVGIEDVIHDIIDSLGEPGVLVHGLAVKPGKPVIIGLVGEVPVFGMPGHPTSCLIIFRELVAPILRKSYPGSTAAAETVRATLTRNFASQAGREEFLPVRLEEREGGWAATPLLGPSALISTLVRANGLLRIPAAAEGVYAGDEVEVEMLG